MKISDEEKTCNYSIWTRRPICNCSRISRASRVGPFEEKDTQVLKKNQRLHQKGDSF
jgi:hypothetical protein